MNTIEFNVDPEANIDMPYADRYEAFLDAIRHQCIDMYQGFWVTRDWGDNNPNRYFNFILQSGDDINITIKVDKNDLYAFARRKGRGEPQPGNNQNIANWSHGNGYGRIITGSVAGEFDVRYKEVDINGRSMIGPLSLQQAVETMWRDEGVNREAFITIVVHVLEPVRFPSIGRRIADAMRINPYIDVPFRALDKALVRHWKRISSAIRTVYEPRREGRLLVPVNPDDGKTLGLTDPELTHMTLGTARTYIAVLKHQSSR